MLQPTNIGNLKHTCTEMTAIANCKPEPQSGSTDTVFWNRQQLARCELRELLCLFKLCWLTLESSKTAT